MEGLNLNFTGVQSYRKFHYDIMKLACTYSYQGKFLEKISGRRAIRNLITVTSSHPWRYFWAQRKPSFREAIHECPR